MTEDSWVAGAIETRDAAPLLLRRDKRCGRFYNQDTMTAATDEEGQYIGTDPDCVDENKAGVSASHISGLADVQP